VANILGVGGSGTLEYFQKENVLLQGPLCSHISILDDYCIYLKEVDWNRRKKYDKIVGL
jgi:hypothetical protein